MSREPTEDRGATAVRDALRDYFREHVCPTAPYGGEFAEVWAHDVMAAVGDAPASLSGDCLAVLDARVDLAALAARMRRSTVGACGGLAAKRVADALRGEAAGYRRRTTWERPGAPGGDPR